MKIMQILKRYWFGRLLVVALCVLLLTAMVTTTPPRKANATLIELLVVIAIIAVLIADVAPPTVNPHAWGMLLNQLKTSIDDASAADSEGDWPKVIGSLGKAGGKAEALMGMVTPCDSCDDVKEMLQDVIGIIALNKSRIVGSERCHPDGIVQGNEECDPLAKPTGCPTDPQRNLNFYCNDECQCIESNPIP